MDIRFDITQSLLVEVGVLCTQWWRKAGTVGLVAFSAYLCVELLLTHCCIDHAFVTRIAMNAAAFAVVYAACNAAWTRYGLYPRRARKAMKTMLSDYTGVTASFDNQGFRMSSLHTHVNWQWEEMKGFRETSSAFLLCSPSSSYILPKQRFVSGEFSELDALIRQKLRKLE